MSLSLVNAFKALSQLGIQPVALNVLYKFGLATGHFRRAENRQQRKGNREWRIENGRLHPLFTFPSAQELLNLLGEDGKARLIAEADEIVAGKVRLFGSEPVPLQLNIATPLQHWTAYETDPALLSGLYSQVPDVKFIWEPARFGWAFTLGRAYSISGDGKYPESFWNYFEVFTDSNPPCLGPQWMSGQEVALRLMAFSWAWQIFATATASTPERHARLAQSIAAHAARIPITFIYARSQQNNHLLSEAAGLFTAGLALPEHPSAQKWRRMGWEWLIRGLKEQIDGYGEYSQHSTNYHRLMLQVVLWTNALALGQGLRWPRQTMEAITRSIHWLLAVLDPDTGRTPNLGANDGANLFPLSNCPFSDYRPVLNSAARAFLLYDLPRGPWDELSLWYGIPLENRKYVQLPRYLGDQIYGKESWATLRTAQFTNRPSHADQLHLDLWWRGLNIAQDAGTYLYNATAPWDNSLTTTRVHNTVMVNGRDQMRRAGRFLYLDWVNAYRQGGYEANPDALQRVRGRYRNYRQGYRHSRVVTVFADDHWRIEDEIMPIRWLPSSFAHPLSLFRLHWLLPDWDWKLDSGEVGIVLHLESPYGPLRLTITSSHFTDSDACSLFRAGESLSGSASPDPIRGWVSPTYAAKVPALSLAIESTSSDDVQFISEFIFP